MSSKVKSLGGDFLRKYGMIFILILMVIGMTAVKPVFIRSANLINIFRQVSVIGTLALGVTLLIITGGIDLSSGSVLALVGVVTATAAAPGQSVLSRCLSVFWLVASVVSSTDPSLQRHESRPSSSPWV